jgi:hypothetical protein
VGKAKQLIDIRDSGGLVHLDFCDLRETFLTSEERLRLLLDSVKSAVCQGRQALLWSNPPDRFAPSLLDEFWKSAEKEDWYPETPRTLYARPLTKAPSVTRLEYVVESLLQVFDQLRILKIVSFSGEVDFDILGLLLAFDVRICDENTVFVNRVLDHGTPPGGCLLWYLTHCLGRAKAMELVLEHRTISAREALELSLVSKVFPADSLAEASIATARRLSELPSPVVRSLMGAAQHLDCDLQTYIKKAGVGLEMATKGGPGQ